MHTRTFHIQIFPSDMKIKSAVYKAFRNVRQDTTELHIKGKKLVKKGLPS